MCGRYAASKNADALVEEFEVDETVLDIDLAPDWNVAPTKRVHVVMEPPPREEGGPLVRQLRVARWGLVPSWAKDVSIGSRLVNARVETLADKPSFRRAFAKRRCLLPADGYYEWYQPAGAGPDDGRPQSAKPRKQPFYIHPAGGESLAMAGLYEWWRDRTLADDDPKAWLLSVTVVTTSASDAVGRIHDRMPLVVTPDRWAAWLDPAPAKADVLTALLSPAAAGDLEAYPVSTAVNSVRNNGPELVLPMAEEPTSG